MKHIIFQKKISEKGWSQIFLLQHYDFKLHFLFGIFWSVMFLIAHRIALQKPYF